MSLETDTGIRTDGRVLFSVGHSTRSIEDFIALLRAAGVRAVADVRRFPGSKRFPWFNSGALAQRLAAGGISYLAMEALGGRRRPITGSTNTAWRNPGFRGYADYMQTADFDEAAGRLEDAAC